MNIEKLNSIIDQLGCILTSHIDHLSCGMKRYNLRGVGWRILGIPESEISLTLFEDLLLAPSKGECGVVLRKYDLFCIDLPETSNYPYKILQIIRRLSESEMRYKISYPIFSQDLVVTEQVEYCDNLHDAEELKKEIEGSWGWIVRRIIPKREVKIVDTYEGVHI